MRMEPDKKRRYLHRVVRIFALSVSTTLSAMVLTTPLCAYYFGMVSLVGVITNLLVLWIISGIFYGIMAICLLHILSPAAAVFLGSVIAWPIRYVLAVAAFMADLPLAAVYTESIYIVFWLVFVYLLLAVFCFGKAKHPIQLFCCAVIGLSIALLVSWMELRTDKTEITILDVGQGQCILLQSEEKTFMVDCGGSSDDYAADCAAEYLLSRGISCLDGIVLTHLDEDHAGGVEELLTRVDTELLILPPVYSKLSGETTVYASEDLLLQSGRTSITVFAAPYPGSDNEKSLCVLFETENCAILITGDREGFGERMLLRNAVIPEVDILVAGHHGSANSTCEELLAAVRPEIVCISAGRNNRFGHPAPALLDRLERFGCTVYRTDMNGTITIRR
jgi:competence protein ComEC